MKVFLHIGLHKTGSTALQNIFSANFINGDIIYNPPNIVSMVEYAIDNPRMRDEYILKAKYLLKILREKNNSKTIFISNENLSQRFCFQDYDYCSQVIYEVFPNAEIIIFIRFQSDWILSCYKQSVQLDDPQSIMDFLNYSDGMFGNIDNRFNSNGLLSLNVHKADWTNLLDVYTKKFGRENIHLYFYENLKNDFKSVVDEIGNLVGMKVVYNKKKRFGNRSYSALACKMTIYRYNIYRFLGLEKFLPISTKLSIDKILQSPPKLSEDEKNVSKPFLSWDDAKVSKSFIGLIPVFFLKVYQRIRNLTWRKLWQVYLDRVIYVDWDLLEIADLREKLNKLTRTKNKRLLKYCSKDELPRKYLYE